MFPTIKNLFFGFLLIAIGISISCAEDDASSNSIPVIEDQSFSVEENAPSGTIVATVIGTDEDSEHELTFRILAGNRDNAFSLDSDGTLTVDNSEALDFETNQEFELAIEVEDDFGAKATAVITVTVLDTDEVHTVSDEEFVIDENLANGSIVGTMSYQDPEDSDNIVFSIISGNTDDSFVISSEGELQVNNSDGLDFETNPSFTLGISTVVNQGIVVEAIAKIQLNDVNEIHTVDDPAFTVIEKSPNETLVGKISIEDVDVNATYDFSIITGNDDDAFEINEDGEVLVLAGCALVYEDIYTLDVTISDQDFNVNSTVTINVTEEDFGSGLIAYYPFDGSADDRISSNNGVVNGATLTTDRNGCSNSAYSFDGIDDYIDIDPLINDVVTNSTGSIVFWIKPENANAEFGKYVISFGDTDMNRWLAIRVGQSRLRFLAQDNGSLLFDRYTDDEYFENDVWTHVACIQDGAGAKIYINGELIISNPLGSESNEGGWFDDYPQIDNASLGYIYQNNITQGYFDGAIDELRIYSRALSSSEIELLYVKDNQ